MLNERCGYESNQLEAMVDAEFDLLSLAVRGFPMFKLCPTSKPIFHSHLGLAARCGLISPSLVTAHHLDLRQRSPKEV